MAAVGALTAARRQALSGGIEEDHAPATVFVLMGEEPFQGRFHGLLAGRRSPFRQGELAAFFQRSTLYRAFRKRGATGSIAS